MFFDLKGPEVGRLYDIQVVVVSLFWLLLRVHLR